VAGALFDAGNAGHINAQSGHGDWHQGLELLGSLYRRAELVVAPQAASAIRTVVVSASALNQWRDMLSGELLRTLLFECCAPYCSIS